MYGFGFVYLTRIYSLVGLQNVFKAWSDNNVSLPQLPVADPADGNSKLWSDGGVVTVGT